MGGTMTVELLDTETESRNGSEKEEEEGKDEKQQQLEAYVARFLGPGEPMTLSPCTVSHLARKPVFLSRSVRSYRAKTRHKIVPRQNSEINQLDTGEAKVETHRVDAWKGGGPQTQQNSQTYPIR